ncbi:MAG: hypothetical protein J1E80_09675 [Desulfovibrionaceae bacterium]|nr:hypothetical protein [Desulfovibrionaceae bacterium]
MALGFIGSRGIASLTENTPEAVQCGLFWDRARRAALEDYPWNFATRRARLAEKPLPEAWAGEWRHCYALPDLCLRALRVGRGGPFRLRGDGQGAFILSDEGQAWLEGVFDTPDVSLWSELFVMAMARRLACLIAIPLLKNNPGKLQELEQLYRMALPKATGQDAAEGREAPNRDAWLQARRAW